MKKILLSCAALALLVVTALHVSPAHAIDIFPVCSSADPGSQVCAATSDKLFGVGGIWNRILETFTFIIGAVSVLMIIVGGIRYVTSNGEQAQISSAKNTILYAIVGVVVAMLAYGIVHFVISQI
jgi:cytochrome bd-type quinol oxidase subunit 2